MNFSIIGEDKRMEYVANKLYSFGSEISNELNNQIIILPPPVNKDIIAKLSPYFNTIKVIYGGAIAKDFINDIPDNIHIIDYLSDEFVIKNNAYLTARGIIKYALGTDDNRNYLSALVVGYGYCGKAIANELKKYNIKTSIAVRNSNLLDEIESNGYNYVDIHSLHLNNNSIFQLIFNTVPAMILDRAVIDTLNSSVKIYDIASKPGGVNFLYCKQKGIFAELKLGIPGKEYPKAAGEIIADFCYIHYMNNFYNPPE